MSIHAPSDPAGLADPPAPAPRVVPVSGLRGSVHRRPVVWFFSLAFALSWLAWSPYILSENGLGVLHFSYPVIGGSGQLLGVLPGAYLGPITAALLVTGIIEGRAGLRAWRVRMTKLRVRWYWFVAVAVAVPAALTVASMVLGGGSPALPSAALLIAYVPSLLIQMVTTGLAEEPGWREFAMPRLQRRYGPLTGTLILGPLWGAWHLPLFLSEWGGWPHVNPAKPLVFIATTVVFSIVMTWVFNLSAESMPLVMLMHTSVNNFFSTVWTPMFPKLADMKADYAFLLVSGVVALVALIVTRGRLGRPDLAKTA
ncbi:CPBP family intramembrane glutamic endopeptidase [Streptomyces heilongjiangensis]|uniref:CPBP family intramembrane glutamic endopeptidase n=1 Tax=Streptomyces heilongjiangensis TaxID=945052 RepID=A0ABW1AYQ2_9ACTN|nr:CPBP family intramembrane glutamic endopeptidase [Streptomyces heilongjiangensis]MDC2951430.1 CPBP family intramembrane metalloprotease [Streptomyces heilongjiangensis]